MLDTNLVCYLSCTIVFVCQEKETKPTKTSQSSKLKVNNYFNEKREHTFVLARVNKS